MVKYLDHLLARHHFLDIAVQISKLFLLHPVISLAAVPAVADIPEHYDIADKYYDAEPPV